MPMFDRFRANRLLTRAQHLLRAGRAAEAIAALTRACALAPTDHGPPLHLALAHAAAGEPRRGLDELERARELFPTPSVRDLFRGRLLLEAGDPEGASRELAAACAQDPANALAQAYHRLARLEASRDPDAARELLREDLGESYAFQRRLVLALERQLFWYTPADEPPFEDVKAGPSAPFPAPPPFDRAPHWTPWGWVAGRWYKERAYWRERAKDRPGALAALHAAVLRRPRDLELAAYYASALFELGREPEALAVLHWRRQELTRAQGIDFLEVPTLALIGLCYYQLGAATHAGAWVDYATLREAELGASPTSLYARALLLAARGDLAGAAPLLDLVEGEEPGFFHDRITTLLGRVVGVSGA